jgi:enoyl-CoA hydratase/carnithine racemase
VSEQLERSEYVDASAVARPGAPTELTELLSSAGLRLELSGRRADVVLAAPQRRNAMSPSLWRALAAVGAWLHDQADVVVLRAEGPSFCAGGDLDELGRRPDPATAHLVRLERSPARSLMVLGDRVTARVHGPCAGSGVELPAFAARVVADPAATFRLPEVGLGLVPGAGGTVSLPRRIGRHRTAWLALTGRSIDAATALDWGLVDEVAPVGP